MIFFRVFGIPIAQGSLRGFVKGGKAILTSTAKGLGAWRNQIADAAARAAHGKTLIPNGGYEVICVFFLPRPKSLPKRYRFPTKRPDSDKLVRSVLDAVTGIVWRDDAQVVKLIAIKEYANEKEPPGVAVEIRSVEI